VWVALKGAGLSLAYKGCTETLGRVPGRPSDGRRWSLLYVFFDQLLGDLVRLRWLLPLFLGARDLSRLVCS